MLENWEILAVFTLLDDPDEEVFSKFSERIVHYGRGIIPNLENLWENTTRNDVQERIEMLIHSLHYTDLLNDPTEWRGSAYHDFFIWRAARCQISLPGIADYTGVTGDRKNPPQCLARVEQLSHTS